MTPAQREAAIVAHRAEQRAENRADRVKKASETRVSGWVFTSRANRLFSYESILRPLSDAPTGIGGISAPHTAPKV
jgi:hypothetical protein